MNNITGWRGMGLNISEILEQWSLRDDLEESVQEYKKPPPKRGLRSDGSVGFIPSAGAARLVFA